MLGWPLALCLGLSGRRGGVHLMVVLAAIPHSPANSMASGAWGQATLCAILELDGLERMGGLMVPMSTAIIC